eukprot:955558_1
MYGYISNNVIDVHDDTSVLCMPFNKNTRISIMHGIHEISLKQQLYIQRCTAKNDINYGTMIQKKVSQSNILNHQINRNQKYIIIILQIFALFKQEGTFRPVCVTLIEDKETFRFEFMFGDRKVRKRLNMHVKY